MSHQPQHSIEHLQDDRLTRAMTRNLATWMDVSVRALGVTTGESDALWWRHPGGSPIYLSAVPLNGDISDGEVAAELAHVQTQWGDEPLNLYECWAKRPLEKFGLTHQFQNPWYVRLPKPAPPPITPPQTTLPDVRIARVTTPAELAEFEAASHLGFNEVENETIPVFSQHAPATLGDPGMCYLLARVKGQPVAGVIFYVTDDMVGLYGISTIPAMRRRGIGAALVRAGVKLYAHLPISVFPDPDTLSLYRDSGFIPAGEIAMWRTSGGQVPTKS